MKVAILSDVHGNHIALKKVVDDCFSMGVERALCLGDVVGYYYWPEEVLKELRRFKQFDFIQGNHERMLAAAINDSTRAEEIKSKYGSGIDAAMRCLSQKDLEFLIDAPSFQVVECGDYKVLMCHGSPADGDQYIYPTTKRDVLSSFDTKGCDIVVMGHSHYPFMNFVGGVVFANPGSVGQPRDCGNQASYLIFDSESGSLVFKRKVFETSFLKQEAKRRDPENKYLATILDRNI